MPIDPMRSSPNTGDPKGLDAQNSSPRLSTSEASSYLRSEHGVNVARATLDKYRCVGGGPTFHRFGKRIVYRREALDAWAIERLGPPLKNMVSG